MSVDNLLNCFHRFFSELLWCVRPRFASQELANSFHFTNFSTSMGCRLSAALPAARGESFDQRGALDGEVAAYTFTPVTNIGEEGSHYEQHTKAGRNCNGCFQWNRPWNHAGTYQTRLRRCGDFAEYQQFQGAQNVGRSRAHRR